MNDGSNDGYVTIKTTVNNLDLIIGTFKNRNKGCTLQFLWSLGVMHTMQIQNGISYLFSFNEVWRYQKDYPINRFQGKAIKHTLIKFLYIYDITVIRILVAVQ